MAHQTWDMNYRKLKIKKLPRLILIRMKLF